MRDSNVTQETGSDYRICASCPNPQSVLFKPPHHIFSYGISQSVMKWYLPSLLEALFQNRQMKKIKRVDSRELSFVFDISSDELTPWRVIDYTNLNTSRSHNLLAILSLYSSPQLKLSIQKVCRQSCLGDCCQEQLTSC